MPRRLRPWLVLLAMPSCLLAMEPEPEVHFGLEASLAKPALDLREVTPNQGLGAGLFFEQDLNNGWSARARFNYVNFKEDTGLTSQRITGLVAPTTFRVAADQVFLGAEVHKRPFFGTFEKFFLLGSLGGYRTEFETAALGTQPGVVVRDKQKTSLKLGYAVGAGWQFSRPFGMTLRYASVKQDNLNLATLEAGLAYRF